MSEAAEMKLGVLGLGHVGLPTALGLAELGWTVIGAEDDRAKAEMIAQGEVPFHEPGVESLLRRHLDTGRFVVEPDTASAIRESTVLFVCVGTPQRDDGAADTSQLEGVAQTIAANLNGYKLVVEKSTTPVQTAQHLKEIVSSYSSDGSRGDDSPNFDIAVNPEFLREGTAVDDFFNPDRIVLGVQSDRAEELLLKIYEPLLHRMGSTAESSVVVTDIDTAEVIKHASNAFLATKISFINMVSDLCDATGANIDDVVMGMGKDPRIGARYFNVGIGYGGYCLPKDITAFTWIANEKEVDFSLLKEVEVINEGRADRFVAMVREAVRVRTLAGKTLAVWGLAFKPGTDDVREAPSMPVVQKLIDEGARLRLFDPQAIDEFKRSFSGDSSQLTYCASAEDAAEGADTVLVLTEWPEFLETDLGELRRRMATPLIVDGRNLMKPAAVRAAGFEYYSVGRP